MFHIKFKPILIIFALILLGCQLQEPNKNHGILFLENRSNKLILNKTNKNDVIRIIGQPHTTSITDIETWIYFERVLVKGEYHKLGKNILKSNNILMLKFDKYGVLEKKKIFNKDDKEKLEFSKKTTESQMTKKSFAETFLKSIKEKMYGNK